MAYKIAMDSRKAKPAKYGHLIEQTLNKVDGNKMGVPNEGLDDGWIQAKNKVTAFRGEMHSARFTPVSQPVAVKRTQGRSHYPLEDY